MPKSYQISLNGTGADRDLYADILSLVVEENTEIAGSFRMKLSARLQSDGTWTYIDDDRFALLTKVTIKIGFTGAGGVAAAVGSLLGGGGDDGISAVFDGYVTNIRTDLQGEPTGAFVEVSGLDTCFLLSTEEKTVAWPDMSDSDIVQQILGKYGVDVEADATQTVHQEDTTTIVQRGTDLQFVRRLARRNGMEFYFLPDAKSGRSKAFFRAPQLESAPQPDLAIRAGDKSNLRSFNASVSAHRPLGVKVSQIDIEQNAVNEESVSDTQLKKLGAKDLNALLGTLGSLATPAESAGQMLLSGIPTADPVEMKTMAQAVRDEAGWLMQASGEINSDAYQTVLRAHLPVLVKGAGKNYSGKYYVTRVIHEIKSDGSYSQKFEARRNAVGVDGSEEFGGAGGGLPIPGI